MRTAFSSGGAIAKDCWKVTLPCTRGQAETAPELDGVALVATEEDGATGRWRLDAYVEEPPSPALLADLAALGCGEPRVERLGDEDWVTLSQAGLEPIREGRFAVHTAAHPAEPPAGGWAFRIEAGRAFGTGHHETTAGCLAMLDGLSGRRFANVIDIGAGTGLLAFAARRLWPKARVTATDIDPVAIDVTRENAAANAVEGVDLLVADGARGPAIEAGAPYDLVIANILAGPLIAMAPEIATIATPGGTVLLAGLLTSQAGAVEAAYHAAGCATDARIERGDWNILRLRTAHRPTAQVDVQADRDGWTNDGAQGVASTPGG